MATQTAAPWRTHTSLPRGVVPCGLPVARLRGIALCLRAGPFLQNLAPRLLSVWLLLAEDTGLVSSIYTAKGARMHFC